MTIDRASLPKLPIYARWPWVRYKDKAGQWQGTNSLSINDLPKAITALQQAYEYLLAAPTHEEQDAPAPPTPMSGIKPVQIMQV